MTKWPRHCEFYVAKDPVSFYEVDLDALLPGNEVSLWLSPRHDRYKEMGRHLFTGYMEETVLEYFDKGVWVVSEIYDESAVPVVVEDLI